MPELEKLIREKVNETGVTNKLYGAFAGAADRGLGSPGVGLKYKQLFHKEGDNLSRDGFENFEDWFLSVHSGNADERLKTLTEGGGDPGYLVPEEFRAEMWDMGLEDSIVRPRATVYPMKRNTLNVPAFDDEDHTTGLYGTVTEQWGPEAGQKDETDPKFRKMGLNARKLTCFTKSSDELKDDSAIPFGQVIGKAFAGAISFYTDRRYLAGNGAGQPLGVTIAPCTITVAGETSQVTLTIVYENVVNMFSKLAPGCWKNAVWVCHNTCLPQLMLLSFPIGTGGSHVPVLKEDSGKLYILGKELLVSEKVPALGNAGCLGLYDFSKYIIGLREDVRIESSIHAQFREDITQWRAIVRTDGQPGIATPITLLSGDEVSPFVILDGI